MSSSLCHIHKSISYRTAKEKTTESAEFHRVVASDGLCKWMWTSFFLKYQQKNRLTKMAALERVLELAFKLFISTLILVLERENPGLLWARFFPQLAPVQVTKMPIFFPAPISECHLKSLPLHFQSNFLLLCPSQQLMMVQVLEPLTLTWGHKMIFSGLVLPWATIVVVNQWMGDLAHSLFLRLCWILCLSNQ